MSPPCCLRKLQQTKPTTSDFEAHLQVLTTLLHYKASSNRCPIKHVYCSLGHYSGNQSRGNWKVLTLRCFEMHFYIPRPSTVIDIPLESTTFPDSTNMSFPRFPRRWQQRRTLGTLYYLLGQKVHPVFM